MSMASSVGTALTSIAIGGIVGTYVAAVKCPDGWWAAADFGSASARVFSGASIGAIAGLIIGRRVAAQRHDWN